MFRKVSNFRVEFRTFFRGSMKSTNKSEIPDSESFEKTGFRKISTTFPKLLQGDSVSFPLVTPNIFFPSQIGANRRTIRAGASGLSRRANSAPSSVSSLYNSRVSVSRIPRKVCSFAVKRSAMNAQSQQRAKPSPSNLDARRVSSRSGAFNIRRVQSVMTTIVRPAAATYSTRITGRCSLLAN